MFVQGMGILKPIHVCFVKKKKKKEKEREEERKNCSEDQKYLFMNDVL